MRRVKLSDAVLDHVRQRGGVLTIAEQLYIVG
jgi:hypothetical protein